MNQVFDRKCIEELSRVAYSIRFQHVRVFKISGDNKNPVYDYLKDKGHVFENAIIKTIFNDDITFSTQSDNIYNIFEEIGILDIYIDEIKADKDEHAEYFITLAERLKALTQHRSDTNVLLSTIIAESELGKLLDDVEYERLYGHFNDKFIQTMMNHIVETSYLDDIDLLNKVILEAVMNIEFYIFSDKFDTIIQNDYLMMKLGFIR